MESRKCIVLTAVLVVALVVSNAWWFYQALDQGVTEKYRDQMLYERLEALKAAHQVMPALAVDLPRREVIKRVESALEDPRETYEKEGWVVVDWVHLRFDEKDRLLRVRTSFDYLGDRFTEE